MKIKIISLILSALFVFDNTLYCPPISKEEAHGINSVERTYLRPPILFSDTDEVNRRSEGNRAIKRSNFLGRTKAAMGKIMLAVVLSQTPIPTATVEDGHQVTTVSLIASMIAAEKEHQMPTEEEIRKILSELDPSHPENEELLKKLKRFLSRIDFISLRNKANSIADDVDRDEFLLDVTQRVRDYWLKNPKEAREFFKLLVPTFISTKEYIIDIKQIIKDIDIFKILAQINKVATEDSVLCSFLSESEFIVFGLLGFNVMVSTIPENTTVVPHIFPCTFEGNKQYVEVLDSSAGIFGVIDLNKYYHWDEKGKHWALDLKHRRPITEKMRQLLDDPSREVINLNNLTEEGKEEEKLQILASRYSSIRKPYKGSATFAIYYSVGNVLIQLGYIDEAIKAYKEAIRRNPNCAEVHNNLGLVYLQSREFDKAKKAFQEALRHKPGFPEVHNNLGLVYLQSGESDKAIEEFREALLCKSDFPEAFNNLGVAYLRSNRLKEAQEAFQKALHGNPNPAEVNNNLGLVFLRSNRLKEAQEAFQKALRDNPKFSEANYNLGLAFLRSREFDKAKKAFQEALRNNNPNPVDIHYNLGLVYLQTGEMDEAIKSWIKAFNLDPSLYYLLPPEVPPEVKEEIRKKARITAEIIKTSSLNERPEELNGIVLLSFFPTIVYPGIKLSVPVAAVAVVIPSTEPLNLKLRRPRETRAML